MEHGLKTQEMLRQNLLYSTILNVDRILKIVAQIFGIVQGQAMWV